VTTPYLDPLIYIHFELLKKSLDVPIVTFAFAATTAGFAKPAKQVGEVIVSGEKELIVSLGNKDKSDLETYRTAGGSLANWLLVHKIDAVQMELPALETSESTETLFALMEGLRLGSFRFERRKKVEDPVKPVTVYLNPGKGFTQIASNLITRVEALTFAVCLARDWAHEPANIINPITLVERAEVVAEKFGLKITVLDDTELEAMGAGAITSVGKGSGTPSRMIILEYPGKGTKKTKKPIALVGKALTFDTGGYSLKDTSNIVGMKYDKCGGVTVIATLVAASLLELDYPIIGVIGAAENAISEKAYRPDDIITTLAGKTVEIISTDAEGRLVLADALTYTQRQFKPLAIIDLATLTGGVVTALGRIRAGIMSNNDALASSLAASGEAVHERLWRLPLDDDYLKATQGDDADLKNSGGREGHPILGGIFLKQFIEGDIPWAHLDIAGVADSPKELPYCQKGATGFGVRLLIHYLENLS
jgi:leucyl aminopeptidase